ncbi:aminotransferase class V-fold PLP-dependent enzyme [Rhizobium johnstonii]
MRIDIAGWSTSGLRCPDVTIDLIGPGSTVPKVTLLQMPNGTGKTTTLEMLIATLSGVATSWDEKTVRSYRRKGDERELGMFVVSLLVDGRQLSIELVLDFEMGVARYRTTNPGSGGMVQSWQPLPAVRRFLAKEFLGLFIFNGEFAARLLDERQTAADDAIDALCQLYLLNEIGEFVEQEWSRRTKQPGAKSDNALTRLRTQLNNMTARRTTIAKARVKAEAQVREIGAEITDLAAKIEDRLGTGRSTREQFNEAKIEMTRTVGRGALFHTDLAQMLAYHPVDVEKDNIHIASLSAHKAYGPKGIGALYVRGRKPRVKLAPLFFGGGQEKGLRPGTLNTAAIVGLGRAFAICKERSAKDAEHVSGLCSSFWSIFHELVPEAVINGPTSGRLANNLSISVDGVEPLALMRRLRGRISFSASSACATDKMETSHVLLAILGNTQRARQAFRIAPGRFTSPDDVVEAANLLGSETRALRDSTRAA